MAELLELRTRTVQREALATGIFWAILFAAVLSACAGKERARADSPRPAASGHTVTASGRVQAIVGPTPTPRPFYRVSDLATRDVTLTAGEKSVLGRVASELTPASRRDLAISFVREGSRRRMIAFIAPRRPPPPTPAVRSLNDCVAKPDCKHYCAFWYSRTTDEVSIDTFGDHSRCTDAEAIWARAGDPRVRDH